MNALTLSVALLNAAAAAATAPATASPMVTVAPAAAAVRLAAPTDPPPAPAPAMPASPAASPAGTEPNAPGAAVPPPPPPAATSTQAAPPPVPVPNDPGTSTVSGTSPENAPGARTQQPTVSEGINSMPVTDPAPAPHTDEDEAKKFAKFDKMREPQSAVQFPGTADSLMRDIGGWRSWLASHNISFEMRTPVTVTGDLLSTGLPRDPQQYNGQRFTLQTLALTANATFGLAGFGDPDGKFVVGVSSANSTFRTNGLNGIRFRAMYWYQSLFDKTVEIKIGYMTQYYEYVGIFVGGSPILAEGISGVLPIISGLTTDPGGLPAANVTVHLPGGLYTKSGVFRAPNPNGMIAEERADGAGLNFLEDNTATELIQEIGLKRAPGPDSRSVWLRGGGLVNFSNFTRFDGKGTEHNGNLYAAADVEVLPVSTIRPHRGLYLGGSYYWSAPEVSIFTQYGEARTYGIGLFDARPQDTISLRASYQKTSGFAERALRPLGIPLQDNQIETSLGYSAHLYSGLYGILTGSHLTSPAIEASGNNALLLSGTLYMIW